MGKPYFAAQQPAPVLKSTCVADFVARPGEAVYPRLGYDERGPAGLSVWDRPARKTNSPLADWNCVMCIFCQPDDNHLAADRLTDEEVMKAERCPNLPARLPATIITGFLGAGKTTLVNWLLQGAHGQRFCVLQNEFGAVPVDDALIVRSERFADVSVITLPTGCICCKVRGDLVEGLKALARGVLPEGGHFDAVVVETSGLSEVGPVAQTFFADKFVQCNFRLDAIIAVADAERAPAAIRLAQTGGALDAVDQESDDGSTSDSEVGDSDLGSAGSKRVVGEEVDHLKEEDPQEDPQDAYQRGQAARLQCEQLCLADVVLLNKLDRVSEVIQPQPRALSSPADSSTCPCPPASNPIHSDPISSYPPVQSYPVPSHPIPSHPTPSRPMPCHTTPSHPIPSHHIPPHLT